MADFSVFKCKLITRNRNLLDCFVHSLIVPAVDGQLGIMRGHCSIVSELGLGIMVAKKVVDNDGQQIPDQSFLIDGGFVQFAENNATILAYDVTGFDGIPMEEVEQMIEKAEDILSADAYATQIRSHEVKKAELIKQLAEHAKYAMENQ
ncbi:MAG: FoF1 ATP synthase subunit delta/epsilon [Sedimentisphaeraceae bacterium JB056]